MWFYRKIKSLLCAWFIIIVTYFLLLYHYHQHQNTNSVPLKLGSRNEVKSENKSTQNIQTIDFYKLQPPSQEWLQSQFESALTLLGITFIPPNNWGQCKKSKLTYYFPNIRTVFTGIPKTGCTNWLRALLIKEGAIAEQRGIHSKSNPYRLNNVLKSLSSAELNEAFSFVVIRNPWTRMISGFQNKLSESSNNRLYRTLAYNIIGQIRGVKDRDQLINLYPTFEEFLKYLILHKDKVDRHFRPQHNIMCVPGAMYHFIVPLEYSDMMREEVAGKVEGDITIRGAYDAASDPRKQRSTLLAKEWFSEIDSDVLSQVYEIYKVDFVFGNYTNFTDPDFPLPKYN